MSNHRPVLPCPNCGSENSALATVCRACGSYVQNRVPTLDLFDTAWGVLEHPSATFRTIALAEHKNYALVLFAFGAWLPMMTFLSFSRAGNVFPSLLTILPLGTILGIVAGIISAPLAGLLGAQSSRLLGGDGSFRNAMAGIAYGLVPLALGAILTLPIQWLTFGVYQYTLNPHPATINPVSHWVVMGIQSAALLWSVFLVAGGLRVGLRLQRVRAFLVSLVVLSVVGGGWWYVLHGILAYIQRTQGAIS